MAALPERCGPLGTAIGTDAVLNGEVAALSGDPATSARSTARPSTPTPRCSRRRRVSGDMFQERLTAAGYGEITTAIRETGTFY